jgi:hypothetical protein
MNEVIAIVIKAYWKGKLSSLKEEPIILFAVKPNENVKIARKNWDLFAMFPCNSLCLFIISPRKLTDTLKSFFIDKIKEVYF